MSNQPADSLSDQQVTLVLFHNDLRISDNATLLKAAELAADNDGRLLLVYAPSLAESFDSKNWGQAYHLDEIGEARQQFLAESLEDLDKSLQRLGNRLLYLKAQGLRDQPSLSAQDSPVSLDSFTQLCQLINSYQVTDICVSQTADYVQNQVYYSLKNKYPQISWHVQSVTTLFAMMPTKSLPQSFTQFRKKVEYDHDLLNAEYDLVISPTPISLPSLPENMKADSKYFFTEQAFSELISVDTDTVQQPNKFKGGETNALIHLNKYFDSDAPSTYKTTRNALDNWSHSTKFSAWLANGSLSVKTLLNRLRYYEKEVVANESTYWIWFELLWREYFYWYALTHQQQLFLFQGISNKKPTTHFDKQRLEQWKNGTTPYPIVNACMNQLQQTGYMSNRGRQIVASCFIHELGLDWRYGATHFERYLIDYDVGSNWGNWQYLAGVGADPRGCRQFNLIKQTQQHDPKGEFIDKWT